MTHTLHEDLTFISARRSDCVGNPQPTLVMRRISTNLHNSDVTDSIRKGQILESVP
jgi:hypothetical protein